MVMAFYLIQYYFSIAYAALQVIEAAEQDNSSRLQHQFD
jgi:hypothetical protein